MPMLSIVGLLALYVLSICLIIFIISLIFQIKRNSKKLEYINDRIDGIVTRLPWKAVTSEEFERTIKHLQKRLTQLKQQTKGSKK